MGQVVKKQKAVIQLSLMATMSALVTVGTLIVQIPNGMGGYFNVGDVMIFVAALTFNPFVGGVAGGLGSALADIMLGFAPSERSNSIISSLGLLQANIKGVLPSLFV